MKNGQNPFRIHVQQWQHRMRPGGNTNILTRILSWIIFGLVLAIGLVVGLLVVLIGWLLMLPLLWRRRKAVKQAWQFTRAAREQARQQSEQTKQTKQQQNSAQSRGTGTSDSQGTTIEGEYKVKDDDR
ncbi:hypothetical protein SAMN06297229_1129 [Pseudidiomarina planktonica]|uniref:Uncharacterized protein n=1 Tax=Pseudidiomarina planktonica TaxID=1323738 RepID=A0A1Y6EVB7_9GAMM|nr:hypothetical protein [Pseudidiomarina planktonica]RUO65462.1 hypothetical protein CWI77_03120 [Pseudidiomarina planktonica]SMQ64890.1 hypothetical protein SAMN06297229_1129 [Pseudidiomarina planktonica]